MFSFRPKRKQNPNPDLNPNQIFDAFSKDSIGNLTDITQSEMETNEEKITALKDFCDDLLHRLENVNLKDAENNLLILIEQKYILRNLKEILGKGSINDRVKIFEKELNNYRSSLEKSFKYDQRIGRNPFQQLKAKLKKAVEVRVFTRKHMLNFSSKLLHSWESHEKSHENNVFGMDIFRKSCLFAGQLIPPEYAPNGICQEEKVDAELQRLDFSKNNIPLLKKYYAQNPYYTINQIKLAIKSELNLTDFHKVACSEHINIYQEKDTVYYKMNAGNFSFLDTRNNEKKIISGKMQAVFKLTNTGFKLVNLKVSDQLVPITENFMLHSKQRLKKINKLHHRSSSHLKDLVKIINSELSRLPKESSLIQNYFPEKSRIDLLNYLSSENFNMKNFMLTLEGDKFRRFRLAMKQFNAMKEITRSLNKSDYTWALEACAESLHKHKKILEVDLEDNKFKNFFKSSTQLFWKNQSKGQKLISDMEIYLPQVPSTEQTSNNKSFFTFKR